MRTKIRNARRLVVKVGSALVTNNGAGLDKDALDAWARQIAALRAEGREVALVSSGAIAAGMQRLGWSKRPQEMNKLQAAAAVGQMGLVEAYEKAFSRHGLQTAQILLTHEDLADRTRYLNARSTLTTLIRLGSIPVINENDTVATAEIRYGDNDHLSALLSHLVQADMLVLLTDTDGLFTADPRSNPGAERIAFVASDDPLLSVATGGAGTDRGSGGMASKLAAARIASWSGVEAVIAAAAADGAVVAAVRGESVGTRFAPHDRNLSARKLWIAFAAEVEGSVTCDEGAKRAVADRGTSLLPAGVTGCTGDFEAGAVVEVRAADGTLVARGLSAMSSAQVRASMGKRTADLDDLDVVEVVHRDDLVVLVR